MSMSVREIEQNVAQKAKNWKASTLQNKKNIYIIKNKFYKSRQKETPFFV